MVAACLAILLSGCRQVSVREVVFIKVDPRITFQTFTGWETTGEIGQIDYPTFVSWKNRVLDLAVNELGINRVRLEIKSGTENPVDHFGLFLGRQTTRSEWKNHLYEVINDNADPFLIDWKGFQFSELDHTIENVILPLKQRLEGKNENLFINLNVVDFTCCRGSSNLRYETAPEEYGEFVLATFLHLQSKYGWVPDAVEVILEPDNAGWSGTQIGRLIVSTGERLKANGFNPGFIAPSNTNMAKAVTWFDAMVQVPGVLEYLSEFSYHRYGGVSDANLQAIATRAVRYGIKTSMLEHIGSGHETLHEDLKVGRNSAWQQFTLAYPTTDNGAQYYRINAAEPNAPKVIMGSKTKFLRQYFKFVRSGAVRIEATSNNNDFDPVAFVNTDGNYVVIIKVSQSGSFAIQGLPPGTYGIKYTTHTQYDVDEADATIDSGQALTTRVPESGVATVYTRARSNY
jgi:hypothetical protein